MKHEIKNRFKNEVLFTYEYDEAKVDSIDRIALEKAIKDGVDLRYANLSDVDLNNANLSNTNLSGSDLSYANLSYANLRYANLRNANLYGADLYGAKLYGADLYGANPYGAKLEGANLYGAKNAPLLINWLLWYVTIDGVGNMSIGCQMHTIEEWKNFTDEQIEDMDKDALEFWNKHKVMLLSLCDSYKHN